MSATFRMSAPSITEHGGRLYLIRVCEELIDGRWEGFVSMAPVEEGDGPKSIAGKRESCPRT